MGRLSHAEPVACTLPHNSIRLQKPVRDKTAVHKGRTHGTIFAPQIIYLEPHIVSLEWIVGPCIVFEQHSLGQTEPGVCSSLDTNILLSLHKDARPCFAPACWPRSETLQQSQKRRGTDGTCGPPVRCLSSGNSTATFTAPGSRRSPWSVWRATSGSSTTCGGWVIAVAVCTAVGCKLDSLGRSKIQVSRFWGGFEEVMNFCCECFVI